MLWQVAMLLSFPALDQKQRRRTGRVECEPGDPRIDTAEAPLPAMSIASMRPQGANAFGYRRETSKNLADVLLNLRGQISSTRR